MVFGSSTANAIAGLAETAQIPTFAIAVSPKIIEGRKFAFLLHVPIMRELKVIFDGVRAHGYKRVAIISATHDATLSLREGFVREFSNSRELQIVSDQEIQPAESDVRTVALRAIAAKPDAIFLNVLPPQAGLTAMQLKSLGFNGGIFGGPPLMNDSEVHAAKGALEGAWAVGVNPTFSQSFVEKYRTKFGESPESTSGTLSYDGAKILARIARGEPVSTVLKNGNTFSGALGTYTLIDQSFDIPGSAWVVRNGKSTQQDAH
jgi:ABC-type branched-subunit amino acid transport system substrate-binding protein